MRFLVAVILSIAVIAVAFNLAKPLPGTNFDESFLPKASSVKYAKDAKTKAFTLTVNDRRDGRGTVLDQGPYGTG